MINLINLVSFLSHTCLSMLFVILLIVQLEKASGVVKWLKKQFNENLVLTNNVHEDFKNSNKCWICKKAYVEGDVKVRDNCHITVKYRDSAHSNCSIKVKLKFLSILK